MNLKVVSFNIRNCDDKNGHTRAERAPRLYNTINEVDPDVIGLQEIRIPWEEYIKKYFGEKYDIYNKYRNETTDVESAPILWKKDKFDLVVKGNFWLSDTPEKESKGWDEKYNCYRMCSYVILKDKNSGKCFTFMNTHFGFGDNCQIKSSKLIAQYAKKLSDHPFFITGDFNMTPDSIGYKEITKYFTDANTVTANFKGATYHGYNPEINNNQHIDYCFIDSKVTAVSYKILDKTFDGKFPSDHYGLFLELNI